MKTISVTRNDEPLVTVLMSVYNGERYVGEAIESILRQTYRHFELVVIDDGSVDRTSRIVGGFKDVRVKRFCQSNRGLTKSLNRGIQLAKGELIARQDADDVSDTRRIERQVEYMCANPDAALVGTWAKMIDETGRRFGDHVYETGGNQLRIAHLIENQFAHGSLIFDARKLRSSGGYDEYFKFAQDYDLTLRLLDSFDAGNIPELLYSLRHCRTKLTRQYSDEQLAYGKLARRLAQARRTGERAWIDRSKSIAEQVDIEKVVRCSYEDEIVYQSMRCGYKHVAREQLRSNIRRHPSGLRNYVKYLLTYIPVRR